MSTILVTGGAGYVGSMVSRELLARDHRVVVADALLFGGEALLDLLSDMKRELLEACIAAGVQVRPLWYLNHLQKPYREMQAHRITRAPQFYDTVLNLPCSISLTTEQITDVVALVGAAERTTPAGTIARIGA